MSARADLCGGRSVMIVPTATSLISLECARSLGGAYCVPLELR
jgi:hypothetical protein